MSGVFKVRRSSDASDARRTGWSETRRGSQINKILTYWSKGLGETLREEPKAWMVCVKGASGCVASAFPWRDVYVVLTLLVRTTLFSWALTVITVIIREPIVGATHYVEKVKGGWVGRKSGSLEEERGKRGRREEGGRGLPACVHAQLSWVLFIVRWNVPCVRPLF